MRITIILLLLCIMSQNATSQAGIKFYTGITSAQNASELITPNDLSQKGNIIGADAHLNSGNMYFVLGGQIARINFLATSESSYFSVENKMTWLKLRVGLGYNIINFNEKMAITAKTLGAVNIISNYPNDLAEAPFDNYNSGTAAGILGLGFTAYNFYIDVEYEKGFFNAVNLVEGTEFDFVNITLGYRI